MQNKYRGPWMSESMEKYEKKHYFGSILYTQIAEGMH